MDFIVELHVADEALYRAGIVRVVNSSHRVAGGVAQRGTVAGVHVLEVATVARKAWLARRHRLRGVEQCSTGNLTVVDEAVINDTAFGIDIDAQMIVEQSGAQTHRAGVTLQGVGDDYTLLVEVAIRNAERYFARAASQADGVVVGAAIAKNLVLPVGVGRAESRNLRRRTVCSNYAAEIVGR